MDNGQIQSDQNQLNLMIEMLNSVKELKFETPLGQEFKNTFDQALEDCIKPSAREYFINLKNQIKP